MMCELIVSRVWSPEASRSLILCTPLNSPPSPLGRPRSTFCGCVCWLRLHLQEDADEVAVLARVEEITDQLLRESFPEAYTPAPKKKRVSELKYPSIRTRVQMPAECTRNNTTTGCDCSVK